MAKLIKRDVRLYQLVNYRYIFVEDVPEQRGRLIFFFYFFWQCNNKFSLLNCTPPI